MQTATVDPLVGRTLDRRYRILERIARGGMSVVYSAVDERLDRLVAVKVMAAALTSDPAFSDRFAREARAAARLTHLNTVAVYDQGDDHGNVFLVMELVQGRTLRELMRERNGTFSPAEALSIMQPVLSALGAAHAAGIVHRDIKPENILLSDEGVVKVADFGLARAVEADAASTRTGLMMGTVAYCSPEQITRGHADPRSDVYACGVVLFELLTGKAPYRGESAMNVAYQHVHSRVPAPSSKIKGIPSEIDELVVMATDSDPTGRPADAAEFLAEIADVRTELDLPAVPVPQRRRPPAPRTKPGRGASGADSHATEVLGDGGSARHDTRVVHEPHSALTTPRSTGSRERGTRPDGAHMDGSHPSGPPPPVVIPPPKPGKKLTERQRRRRRGLIALLVVLLLGAGAGVSAWWFASGRYSKVPDVRGASKSVAENTLKDAGFKVRSVSSDFSETVPKDQVVSTDPGIGSRLQRGKSVSIMISLGKYRIAVPALDGLSVDKAQSTLQAHGLPQPKIVSKADDTAPVGDVISSSPKAGDKVRKGTVVTVYVSTGPPILQIPDIEPGTPADAAQDTLRRAGFKTTTTKAFSDDYGAGQVISISPTGEARKFSTVTIAVSKGPEMVTIPEIAVGSPTADAQATLENIGLNVKVKPFLPMAGTGHVYRVTPGPGKSVKIGSTVTITAY